MHTAKIIFIPIPICTSENKIFSKNIEDICFLSFLRLYLFYFILLLERGKGGWKRGRETSMCKRYIDRLPLTCPQPGTRPATQACALTGNRTSDLSVHRLVLNPLSHTSQGDMYFLMKKIIYQHKNVQLFLKLFRLYNCQYVLFSYFWCLVYHFNFKIEIAFWYGFKKYVQVSASGNDWVASIGPTFHVAVINSGQNIKNTEGTGEQPLRRRKWHWVSFLFFTASSLRWVPIHGTAKTWRATCCFTCLKNSEDKIQVTTTDGKWVGNLRKKTAR